MLVDIISKPNTRPVSRVNESKGCSLILNFSDPTNSGDATDQVQQMQNYLEMKSNKYYFKDEYGVPKRRITEHK